MFSHVLHLSSANQSRFFVHDLLFSKFRVDLTSVVKPANLAKMKYAIFTLLILTFSGLSNGFITLQANAAKALAPVRTEIKITPAQRSKLKDISRVLQMATMTPIVNRNDEVICMEISEINDKIISDVLKAKVGDCFSEVRVFKKEVGGRTKSETYSVLSISDTMALYQALLGAHRVEVDLNRKSGKIKEIVALSYIALDASN